MYATMTVYTSEYVFPSDLQLSIQQPSQHEQHSLSGIDLFDLMKVLVSGAMISRMMYGLCFFFFVHRTCIPLCQLWTAHTFMSSI